MGEISFGFKAIPEPRRETVFKYQYADSIEYGFTYERCIALSDTSIFNNPVSIIKVAMGLSALYPLFVDKMAHSSRYHSLTSEFNKISDILSDNSKQQDYSINKTKIYPTLMNKPSLCVFAFRQVEGIFKFASNLYKNSFHRT